MMHKRTLFSFILLISILFISSCDKDVKEFVTLFVEASDSPGLSRLDNSGNPVSPAPGNEAISPLNVNKIAINYIELVPNDTTGYKEGVIIYKSPETYGGGELAIHFDSLLMANPGDDFFNVNLKKIPPGVYSYVRISIAYMSYDIPLNIAAVPGLGDIEDTKATFACLLGFRTYVNTITPLLISKDIQANKERGYWLLETQFESPNDTLNTIYSWQLESENITTVNVLAGTAPIPGTQGVITGIFPTPLEVLEEDTRDIRIHLGLSTNGLFEWDDINGNGFWDFNAGDIYLSEPLIDFGIRGVEPSFEFIE